MIPVTLIAAAGSADAQSIGDSIANALDRNDAILQQQADTERMRVESERRASESAAGIANAQAKSLEAAHQGNRYSSAASFSLSRRQFFLPVDRDSLAGFDPATYRMGNGMVLRVTGLFEPEEPTVCIANCP